MIMNEISRHPDEKLVVEGALKLGAVRIRLLNGKMLFVLMQIKN